MKSKLFLTGLAIVALTMAGCQQDELVDSPALKGNTSIKASMEGVTTRSAVADNGTFSWVAGDQISVYTSKGTFKTFETTGEGSGNVTFTGNLESDETLAETGYAVYPAGSHAYKSSTLTINLPATYDYTDAYTPNTNAIMVADMNSDNLEFKHVGGVLRFVISNMPKDAAQFVFTANTPITGKFTVTTDETDAYIATPATDDAASYGKTVTIKFPAVTADPSSEESMTFYVPLPTGTYNGFTVSIQKADNTELGKLTATATNVLKRADLGQFKVFDCATDMKIAATMDEVTSAFSNPQTENNEAPEVSVTIPATVENDEAATITLDEKFTAANNTTPSKAIIAYEAAPTSVTINEETTSSATPGESKGEVRVVIPATTETSSKPNITINTPNLTAGLYADDSSVGTHYGEVTATTATNTLIVGTKVTVDKVVVNGGNVRVNAGAKLTAIERGSDNTNTVYVYYEDVNTLPENYQNIANVTFISAEEEKVIAFQAAMAAGGEVQLTEDLDITDTKITVPASVTTTLDLNGHTLTAANDGNITVLGNLTLKDSSAEAQGKIVASKDYGTPYTTALIYVQGENAKFTMESGTIYAVREDAVNKGQFGVGVSDGGDFTITDGRIEAGWYAISGNGTDTKYNSEINISGGELISTMDYAVYLPQSGTTTITGGTINGAAGGISIQRGTLNISGNAQVLSDGTGNTGDWDDGTGDQANSSLMVAGEYGTCTVNISGGTFKAEGDAITLATGTDTNVITVSGGTFSDLSVLPYVAENANVNIALNGDVTIENEILMLDSPNAAVSIDLQDNTLTLNQSSMHVKNASLTITGGNISAQPQSEVHDAFATFTNGSITMDGVTYTSTGAGMGTATTENGEQQANGSKITVRNSTITANTYAISTNATTPVPQDVVITLENSTFNGTSPLLFNIPCTATITNCHLNGTYHGMILRGGTATITDSEITLNWSDSENTPAETIANYFDSQDWGSGNMVNCAGLTVGNKSTGYQYPTNLTLENTAVQSIGTNASYFPAMYVYANSGADLGVTLTYDDQCTFTTPHDPTIEYGSTNITVNGTAVENQ